MKYIVNKRKVIIFAFKLLMKELSNAQFNDRDPSLFQLTKQIFYSFYFFGDIVVAVLTYPGLKKTYNE